MKVEELKKIDAILTRIRGEFEDYNIITPNNTDEEYEKFKQNKEYNPILKYNFYDITPIIKELKNVKIHDDGPVEKLFLEIRNYLLEYANQLSKIGTDEFHTEHLFEKIEDKILLEAKKILEKELPEAEEKEKLISAKDLGKTLQEEIKKDGLKDWKVKYNPNSGSTVNINGGKKEIIIREGMFFSKDHVKKLIVHEVGTHVLRSENGRSQDFKIFSAGLPNYLSTEEGLASYNEETQNVSSHYVLKRLARNVLMTKVASEKSFVEVFKTIRPYFEEDNEEGDYKCFKMCARIKRGLGDTSKPGGFLKDHSYFQGYHKIKKFVENGGDIKQLYAGKIGLQHLYLLEKGVLKYPKLLPTFLE